MSKLTGLLNQLRASFLERDDILRGLLLGMLSGHHVMLVGRPGTAKSMLVQNFGHRLTGGRFFSYLMTKFTKPDEIIGPVSLESLEKGDYRRILQGRIADAHFAFLDEIFQSNSGCANAVLTILNERKIQNGREMVDVPLITLVGATNELPHEATDELSAFYDRFMLRFKVDYIKDKVNLIELFDVNPAQKNLVTFTLQELRQWQEEVAQVDLPRALRHRVVKLFLRLREEGVALSDRRLKESGKILQAHAYLAGRNTVSKEDMVVLADIFWNREEERLVVRELLKHTALPLEERLVELVREAAAILEKVEQTEEQARRHGLGSELNLRLTSIEEEIKDLRALAAEEALEVKDFNKGLEKVDFIHQEVIQLCLGLDPKFL